MAKILIVDDEESVCRALGRALGQMGHSVRVAPTAEKAFATLDDEDAELVILDVRLPGMDGLEALGELKARGSKAKVIIITAHGTMDTAIEAMQLGAFEYLTKPVDIATAQTVVARALDSRRLAADSVELSAGRDFHRSGILVGNTPVMAEVYKKIGTVARSHANVLIVGESGTGKELTARAIHDASLRREGPFEPVNCAALPETLLESELFGFEKGAFTGATYRRIGKFERASGGTLFLDEVGEMPPGSQAKLLRVIQEREIERLGGTERIPIDIRIIVAVNEPLEKRIVSGTFREDLYYRLKVVTIALPPLKRRLEDIPLLTASFLAELGAGGREVAMTTLDALKAYHWPGNVRELKNAVEHAVVLSRGAAILPEHLPEHITSHADANSPAEEVDSLVARYLSGVEGGGDVYAEIMDVWERPLIARVLTLVNGNQVKAAAYLGINRSTLRKKIQKYGLGRTVSD
jgi:DNA-binding NtrC family response regulator